MASLEALPFELLQRIACHLPCTSALNLIRVNYRIRQACNNRLVFRNIALVTESDKEWDDGGAFLANASNEDTIRVAHAVEKASLTPEVIAPQLKAPPDHTTGSGLCQWLPHLLSLRHPQCLFLEPKHIFVLYMKVSRVLASGSRTPYFRFVASAHAFISLQESPGNPNHFSIADRRRVTGNFVSLAFCLTMLLLQRLSMGLNPPQIFHSLQDIFTTQSGYTVRNLLQSAIPEADFGSPPPKVGLPQAAALLPALVEQIVIMRSHPFPTEVPLPLPSQIPFSANMSIPVPFLLNTSKDFATCHLKAMTTPEFLSDTWQGYYTDHRGMSPAVDPPMRDIQLLARAPDPKRDKSSHTPRTIIDRTALLGRDAHGEFRLRGEIGHDGSVQMVKSYEVDAVEWGWQGTVTPFGIVGTWGGNLDDFGGYFWIWKEKWCVMPD